MSGTLEASAPHPLVAFAGDLHAALDDVRQVPTWSAPPAEQRTALVELARAKARLEELWLRLLAAGDRNDVAADAAATSTAAWLAAQTRRHPGAAAADVRLARALDEDDSPRRTRPERRGQAFCELLERLPADRLPTSGGVSATVVVLLDHDTLVSGLGTARLDTGERVSASLARRLACQAGVIPAVVRRLVDGGSVVLDMGRKRRLHTEHMRIALTIEQGGHCDRPAGWCHAHHEVPWSAGGPTSVANGRLLCSFHHHKAHSPGFTLDRLPGGQVRFHRRT